MFHFGKKPNIKKYAVVGILLTTTIASLSQCTKIEENTLWDFLDEIQRKYFPQTIINDFIIKDPEKLNNRIIRDVNNSIQNVTPEYNRIIREYDKRYQPQYHELENDSSLCHTKQCKALSPPIRMCAPWVEGCN